MTDALPRALLVDLDDTILAYSSVSEPVWADVCRRHAPGLGLDPVALHRAIHRRGVEYWSDPERHHWGRLHMAEARTTIVYDALTMRGAVACAETRAKVEAEPNTASAV